MQRINQHISKWIDIANKRHKCSNKEHTKYPRPLCFRVRGSTSPGVLSKPSCQQSLEGLHKCPRGAWPGNPWNSTFAADILFLLSGLMSRYKRGCTNTTCSVKECDQIKCMTQSSIVSHKFCGQFCIRVILHETFLRQPYEIRYFRIYKIILEYWQILGDFLYEIFRLLPRVRPQ